jgi:hypothetical protein
VLGQRLQHVGAEAADCTFLDGHEHVVLAGQSQHHFNVERLGEAGIGHRGREAVARELLGRLEAIAEPRAEREQRNGCSFAHDAAFSNLQRQADFGNVDADAVAARIPQCGRTVVDGDLGRDHMDQFGLIGRRHQDEARQATEIGNVERPRMGRAVGADQAGAVEREPYRQALDRHVMHDLVIGALQECRIDHGERLVPFGGQAGGKGHRVLLGDSDVKGPLGEHLAEHVHAGARRHRRRDRDNAGILSCLLDQAFAEHLRVGGSIRFRLGLFAGRDVELDHTVVLVVGRLGRRIAVALFGDDMHQNRSGFGVPHVLEHRQEMVEIVTIDRADVVEAELFEQGAAGDKPARIFLDRQRALFEKLRQRFGKLLDARAQRAIGMPGDEAREIGRKGADRRRNGHVVVVQDDDETRIHRSRVVHRLISHPC